MAKYTVTHTCGHTVEVALFGKHVERDRRIAAMSTEDCPACRAAGSDLVGSVKQVAWAQDIRDELAPRIIAAHDRIAARLADAPARPGVGDFEEVRAALAAAIAAKRDELLGRTAARDWIDGRSDDGSAAYMHIIKRG